jgi:hypothetical protein
MQGKTQKHFWDRLILCSLSYLSQEEPRSPSFQSALTIDNTFSALLWPQSSVCVPLAVFVQGRIPLRPESTTIQPSRGRADAPFRQVYIFRVCLGQVYFCLAAPQIERRLAARLRGNICKQKLQLRLHTDAIFFVELL